MAVTDDHILTLTCPDKPGIVHAVTGVFAAHHHNVLDLQQFSDPASRRFFMRVHFCPAGSAPPGRAGTDHLLRRPRRQLRRPLPPPARHARHQGRPGGPRARARRPARRRARRARPLHAGAVADAGARPYHQAYERGVKITGATAHFVTADLDEGPIIEQRVARVDHGMDPKELAEQGSNVESQVLAAAVRWYADRRVFLNGVKTVVFA
ncbi:hypothetical protein HIM_09342 [Hirsutella minnesotensis 3608]|uniref:ACT domain-containing protein n=1 Tax=Hirsutella minnesotensis 3608 TaxID=1043627 RepID=A0A0F8A361_9HYPO|nr:hypothetical protein HIM_09342 [Hirsutella minnesotensis 3608]